MKRLRAEGLRELDGLVDGDRDLDIVDAGHLVEGDAHEVEVDSGHAADAPRMAVARDGAVEAVPDAVDAQGELAAVLVERAVGERVLAVEHIVDGAADRLSLEQQLESLDTGACALGELRIAQTRYSLGKTRLSMQTSMVPTS